MISPATLCYDTQAARTCTRHVSACQLAPEVHNGQAAGAESPPAWSAASAGPGTLLSLPVPHLPAHLLR